MASSTRAAHARNLVGPFIRSAYKITVHDHSDLPRRGAVLLLTDWNNIAAPAVLKAGLPRPVHVWASGPAALPGPLMSVTGDLAVPDEQPGVVCLSEATRLLQSGEAVAAIGPLDVGYAIARTGAPIQTVRISAPPTKRPTDPPRRGSAITISLGPLRHVPDRLRSDQPTRATVRAAGEWARQILVDQTDQLRELMP